MTDRKKRPTRANAGARRWVAVFGAAYVIALVCACLGSAGLGMLGDAGAITYNYGSAGHPVLYDQPVLDSLGGALTGGSLLGFIYAGGLCLALAAATALLYVRLAGSAGAREKVGAAFVCGIVTAIVSIACLAIVVPSCFSSVQLMSMSSSAGGSGGVGAAACALVLAVGSLVAAASLVLRWAVRQADAHPGRAWLKTVIATAVCGIVVLLCVENAYRALAQVELDAGALAGALVVATMANVVMAGVAGALDARGGGTGNAYDGAVGAGDGTDCDASHSAAGSTDGSAVGESLAAGTVASAVAGDALAAASRATGKER
ncbi:MAG: hypothetical protein SOI38_06695 [Eggerthellaceae bacterium]